MDARELILNAMIRAGLVAGKVREVAPDVVRVRDASPSWYPGPKERALRNVAAANGIILEFA